MRTIYLHVGRGKTGTTTIQKYMAENRARLREQGVHYVFAGDGRHGTGHQDFGKSFIADIPFYMIPPVEPDRIRKEIYDEIAESDAESIVLSTENFVIADIAAVREYFEKLPVDCTIKIILFARSQDEVAESEYNQLVKIRREIRPFSQYLDETFEGCDFMSIAEEWENHFGRDNIICRVCDSARKDSVRQFLSCIGGADLLREDPPVASDEAMAPNASIGFRALVTARLLNALEIPERDAFYRKVFAQLAGGDLPALLFDSGEARAFRSQFGDSNRAFTARYLGRADEDLGGRRYTDEERDDFRRQIKALRLDSV